MAMTFELWRLVAVKDEARGTWELVGRFPNAKRARLHIYELARDRVVSPEDNVYWYEDVEGIHTFRIEAVPAAATEPH